MVQTSDVRFWSQLRTLASSHSIPSVSVNNGSSQQSEVFAFLRLSQIIKCNSFGYSKSWSHKTGSKFIIFKILSVKPQANLLFYLTEIEVIKHFKG